MTLTRWSRTSSRPENSSAAGTAPSRLDQQLQPQQQEARGVVDLGVGHRHHPMRQALNDRKGQRTWLLGTHGAPVYFVDILTS